MKLNIQKFSGGSYDYMFYKIKDTYCNKMFDIEMNHFMEDFVKLLKELEWWKSDDIAEEDYRKALKEFKTKWFGKNDKRIKDIINHEYDKLRKDLLESLTDDTV